jgi:rare lipoprotein A
MIVFALSATMLMLFGGCASKKSYKKGSPATMRTYKVHGKRYNPTYVKLGQKMKGISSWYGPNFHGKSTSNGERYNMHARTAAHKTWPMNTMVKVTNLQNGKSTVVRINDRGPFVRGRIIDCSYRAGKEIGLDRMGIAKVQIQVLGFAGKIQSPKAIKKLPKSQQRVRLSNFGIQVGAFRLFEGAQVYQRKYAQLHPGYNVIIKKMFDEEGNPINRVWLMGFGSEDEARDYKAANDLPGAFIVRE